MPNLKPETLNATLGRKNARWRARHNPQANLRVKRGLLGVTIDEKTVAALTKTALRSRAGHRCVSEAIRGAL